jgi:hypothetical protein
MEAFHYNDLPKHKKYKSAYKKFDFYWGIGVEHETYLKTSQTKEVTTFEGCMKHERYSVDYYSVYKQEELKDTLNELVAKYGEETDQGDALRIPILLNSHSFIDADVYGEHKTTYEKKPKPNPNYSGKTFFDWIKEHSSWMRDNYDKSFVWDGDSIEFMTQDFYKVKIKDVMKEIRDITDTFEKELKSLPKIGILKTFGPLRLAAPKNEPFASYLTNLRNVAMFNNGTLHINLTLPTRLDMHYKPLFWNKFVRQHQRLARLVQWLEPFLIAVYGSGDPLAEIDERYASGSQRVAVSRYIGLGTYDTEKMPTGKILQIPRKEEQYPWYKWLYERTCYKSIDKIGMDINFNKHGAHGLELRFFDQMSYNNLEEILHGLVLVMDCALQIKKVADPKQCLAWQEAAGQALLEGQGWSVSIEQIEYLMKAFHIFDFVPKEPMNVVDVLKLFFGALSSKKGKCWELMV